MLLPTKLITTIKNIDVKVVNRTNRQIIKDFCDYLRNMDTAENYQNELLKVLIRFADYFGENKNSLKIIYLPKGSPQFNAVEESWRQGKYDLSVSRYYSSFTDLKSTFSRYYMTRKFRLDIVKYLIIDD